MDTPTTIKGLLFALGLLLAGIAGQPVMNWMLGDRSMPNMVPAFVITGFGLLLVVVAYFWTPREDPNSRLLSTLARVAGDARTYFSIILMLWVYVMVGEFQKANEIVSLRNDIQAITGVIERGVLPRQVTKRQQETISDFLKQFEPCEFSFRMIPRDEEAGSYRADIHQALTRAGWNLASTDPYAYSDSVPEGLTIDVVQTVEHASGPAYPRAIKTDMLVSAAFGLANVRIYGMSSGGKGREGLTRDLVIISIGHNRKDAYVITPPIGPF